MVPDQDFLSFIWETGFNVFPCQSFLSALVPAPPTSNAVRLLAIFSTAVALEITYIRGAFFFLQCRSQFFPKPSLVIPLHV